MEVEASYDVVNESYCRIDESDTSEESNVEVEPISIKVKLLNFFRRRKFLKKRNHCEVAKIPHSYWEISSDNFENALSLRPQFNLYSISQSTSLTDITLETNELGNNEEAVGDLLTLDDSDTESDDAGENKKRVRFAALKHLKSMNQPDIDIKILIFGDSCVGKTSIVRRFVQGVFERNEESIEGIPNYETKLMKLQNNQQFCLHIFDISSDKIPEEIITSSCITPATGAIIVFDINNPVDFASIKKRKRELEAKARAAKIKVPCILLANKCDLINSTFDSAELDPYCASIGIVCWFDTSAKTDFNIKNAFVFLSQAVTASQKRRKTSKAKNKHTKINVFAKQFKQKTEEVLSSYDEQETTML